MTKPKHGVLLHLNDEWFFCPGSKSSNPRIPLPQFKDNSHMMITQGHLAQGHTRFSLLTNFCSRGTLRCIVANNISAANLTSHEVPTLLQHHYLPPVDRQIWDAAYAEEYDGLASLPAWECVTEQEYQKIKTPSTKLIPTMEISTIKFDKDGLPLRAKYPIVALGNLDWRTWSKSNTYTPLSYPLWNCAFSRLWRLNTNILSKMET